MHTAHTQSRVCVSERPQERGRVRLWFPASCTASERRSAFLSGLRIAILAPSLHQPAIVPVEKLIEL